LADLSQLRIYWALSGKVEEAGDVIEAPLNNFNFINNQKL